MAINPSLLIVPYRYKAAKLYSQLPESGDGDFTVVRGTTATRVNASGLIESVASGVPRLDYSGGGCPALLVEPAATNLAILSEDYSGGGWAKTSVTLINDRNLPDPFGGSNASAIRIDASNGNLQRVVTGSSGQQYAGSFFIRRIKGTGACFLRVSENENIAINPTTEWQRFDATRLSTSTTIRIGVGGSTIGDEFAVIGAQLETGNVATSYIFTGGAIASRNADVISLSSASGLIGQTEGAIYAEVDATNFVDGARIFELSDTTADNSISLRKQSSSRLRALVTTASGTVADISTASGQVAGTYKIALAYAANDFVLYVNGTQIGTDTSGAVPATSKVNFGSGAADGNQLNDKIAAAAIYTSRLSNSELQSLTQL